MLAGTLNVWEAPLARLAPLMVTTKPALLPGISWLDARIRPKTMGLKLDPPPRALENLLPGTVCLVSSVKLPATRASQLPLLQYALKPELAPLLPVPPTAGQKPSRRM